MINILIIDDEPEVLDVQERIVKNFFKQNDIEDFKIDTAINGNEAIKLMNSIDYHLLFLDYMMPVANGIDVLESIRFKNKNKHQPYICMVTAMGTPENLELFKSKKASSYVLKPFKIKTINLMLDTYLTPIIEQTKRSLEVDEFVDFDDFDSFDHEDIDVSCEEKDIMHKNNLNHKKVSAQKFLADLGDLDYILEDVNEIDELLSDIIESLDKETIEHYKEDISTALSLYTVFLRSLSDFDDLTNTLEYINNVIEELDLDLYDEKKKKYIIETIRAILQDISFWKETVFIKKDAIDVFYIGASNYNSYLQLKELLSQVKN